MTRKNDVKGLLEMNSKSTSHILPIGFAAPHTLSGLPKNTPIIVAYSGGSDSGALLDMVVRYAEKNQAKVYAAHVNHGIRGKEADRDEEFCRKAAKKYGIEIFILRADVPEIARQTGKSIETAARDVRYEYFSKLMTEKNIPILCVAHNADDNFETILFNISRGSGLSGVCGIPRTRDFEGGIIIRPLLEMSKEDINKYCSDNNIDYVIDSTNTDTEYTRNRIRSCVIPELKSICPGAERAAARLSATLREDSLCLESMATWFLDEARDGFFIETEKLCGSPYSIASRALMSLYTEISNGGSLEYTHIKSLFELAERSVPHSSLDLPGNIKAVIENSRLGFVITDSAKKDLSYDPFYLELKEGCNHISEINTDIALEYTENNINIYKKSMNLLIDSAKIVGVLYARDRRTGEKIRINSMGKSIKKLLCDNKVPLELRNRLPVICDDTGIIGMPFIGVADSHKPTRSYEKTIHIEIKLM